MALLNSKAKGNLLLQFLACAFFMLGAYFLEHYLHYILDTLRCSGPYTSAIFIALYCLMSIFCLPNVLLALAGGAIFGVFKGTLLNLVGATVGAFCGFMLSRYQFKNALPINVLNHSKIMRLIDSQRGWKTVAVLRLMPFVPYNLVNYGLGLTKIRLSHFLLASAFFLIPNKILITYCGYKGVEVFDVIRRLLPA